MVRKCWKHFKALDIFAEFFRVFQNQWLTAKSPTVAIITLYIGF